MGKQLESGNFDTLIEYTLKLFASSIVNDFDHIIAIADWTQEKMNFVQRQIDYWLQFVELILVIIFLRIHFYANEIQVSSWYLEKTQIMTRIFLWVTTFSNNIILMVNEYRLRIYVHIRNSCLTYMYNNVFQLPNNTKHPIHFETDIRSIQRKPWYYEFV